MLDGDFWNKLRTGLGRFCYAVAAIFAALGIGLVVDGLRRHGDKLTATKGP
jgi:hypothetical protein